MPLRELLLQYPAAVAVTIAVGTLVVASIVRRVQITRSKKSVSKPFLGTEEYIPLELKEKIVVSHDTRIFRFNLSDPGQVLGLPIGQHMSLKASVDGKDIVRSYTPITSDDDRGTVDLMVKVYFPNVHPKFPDGGKMSQYLEKLRSGDTILVKGPTGRFEYLGRGKFRVKTGKDTFADRCVKHFGMIAGGTGITPMLQIIRHILKDPSDVTTVHLLFANQTEEDILLRNELEECAKDARFKLWYTLDRPGSSWKYSSGFVDYPMVEQHMPVPGDETVILMCGPLPMINFACKPNLEKRGFREEQMFAF